MPVNKNGLPFYLDRKLDVIRFGVDPDNHVKEQRPFKSMVKTGSRAPTRNLYR